MQAIPASVRCAGSGGLLQSRDILRSLHEVLHEFIHAIALGSAARNSGNFGPEAALLASCTTILISSSVSTPDCRADTPAKFKCRRASTTRGPAHSPPPILADGAASCSALRADTAYFCAKTKVGTPEIPCRRRPWPAPRSGRRLHRSPDAGVRRRHRAAIGGRLHQHVGVVGRAVPEIHSISRCFMSADFPCAPPSESAVAVGRVGLAPDQIGPVVRPSSLGGGDRRARRSLCRLRLSRIRGEIFVAADAFARHPRI